MFSIAILPTGGQTCKPDDLAVEEPRDDVPSFSLQPLSRLSPSRGSLVYSITAGGELFFFRGSFSFKKSASYFSETWSFPQTTPPSLAYREKLHARVLL